MTYYKGKQVRENLNQDKLENKIIQDSFEVVVASKLDKECKHHTVLCRWEVLLEIYYTVQRII